MSESPLYQLWFKFGLVLNPDDIDKSVKENNLVAAYLNNHDITAIKYLNREIKFSAVLIRAREWNEIVECYRRGGRVTSYS